MKPKSLLTAAALAATVSGCNNKPTPAPTPEEIHEQCERNLEFDYTTSRMVRDDVVACVCDDRCGAIERGQRAIVSLGEIEAAEEAAAAAEEARLAEEAANSHRHTYCEDRDGDGYYADSTPVCRNEFEAPEGYVLQRDRNSGDCNDRDAEIHPYAYEDPAATDRVDRDCDGEVLADRYTGVIPENIPGITLAGSVHESENQGPSSENWRRLLDTSFFPSTSGGRLSGIRLGNAMSAVRRRLGSTFPEVTEYFTAHPNQLHTLYNAFVQDDLVAHLAQGGFDRIETLETIDYLINYVQNYDSETETAFYDLANADNHPSEFVSYEPVEDLDNLPDYNRALADRRRFATFFHRRFQDGVITPELALSELNEFREAYANATSSLGQTSN